MSPKNNEKKPDSLKELEKNISPLLVINNPALKPYIELFEYAPENIYQKPLGNLVGFFEIKEYSEESAYVVNFLTSVLKKEYYANPRRSVADSLDSTLHKVNLALSEIAKHGHVDWIGKLHACICVLEKNALHFATTGNAKLFLNRKKVLTEISEGLSSEESQPHPLKTFVNVSSGHLEREDKLIITSEDIFHILTLNDLKKNLIRLDKVQFVQFLKTALSNELEMIATIVIDLEDSKKKIAAKKIIETEEPIEEVVNVFSQAAFVKEKATSEDSPLPIADLPTATPVIEYTDQKTGHIYVQGEELPPEASLAQLYWEIAQEKISDGWQLLKENAEQNFRRQRKNIAKQLAQLKSKLAEQRQLRAEAARIKAEKSAELAEQATLQQAQAAADQPLELEQLKEKTLAEIELEFPEQKISPTFDLAPKPISKDPAPASENLMQAESQPKETLQLEIAQLFRTFLSKNARLLAQINFSKLSLIPHFSRLPSLFHKFSAKQKRLTLFSLIAIFIVPIFIANWLNRPKQTTITDLAKIETAPVATTIIEKNLKTINQTKKIFAKSELKTILATNLGFITTTAQSIFLLKENGQPTEYQLPTNSGLIVACTYMQDLSMLLILTDQNKLFSFLPSTSKFIENKIELPANFTGKELGTYLTYLYVLDASTNQILRYPRADGGFGAKLDWLKENADLKNAHNLIIDENVYLVQNNQVLKFFKGKKQNFELEAPNTSMNFDQLFTGVDTQFFYAIDNKNSRLIQYEKTTGKIVLQFSNEIFKTATAFAVDEKSQTAFVINKEGLSSVALQ